MRKTKKEKYKKTSNKLVFSAIILSLLTLGFVVLGIHQRTQPNYVVAASTLIVNHTNTDASSLTQAELDTVRQLDILFNHQSVGGNILSGIDSLQSQNPTRYTIGRASSPNAAWYDTNAGIGDFRAGKNGDPGSKITGFDGLVRGTYGSHLKVAFMKLCYVDFGSGQSAWDQYRSTMEALIRDYPNITFVWWTAPLETSSGNAERGIFNNYVRQYVQTNGGVLYDLAAIESHDPSGNIIHDGKGSESLYPGYASDNGHLNASGSQRAASALWYLLAKSANTTAISPKLIPTMWCMGGQPCTSPEPTNLSQNPTSMPISNVPDGDQTLDPCDNTVVTSVDESTQIAGTGHKHRHKQKESGFMSQLLEWLLDFLKKLFELLGIEMPDVTNPDQADPDVNNPNPTSGISPSCAPLLSN